MKYLEDQAMFHVASLVTTPQNGESAVQVFSVQMRNKLRQHKSSDDQFLPRPPLSSPFKNLR